MESQQKGLLFVAGNSHPELAKQIVERMNISLGECAIYNKPNRETVVDIKQSLRGKDVFILQTGTKDVNNNVMELLIMIYAAKTSSARTITVVMPYIPYSKQCKMRQRNSIVTKLLADMICKAGAHRLVTMDLYRKEIQGFFGIPVDNLRASPFLLGYIKENVADYRNAVIVAKNAGVMNKATSYAERLRLSIAVIHGEQKEEDGEQRSGHGSPPPFRRSLSTATAALDFTLPVLAAKEKPPLTVVGDVGGRIAIIVDDMIDEVESFVSAAEVLKQRGAYKIIIVATHGLLSADAPTILEKSPIDEVIVTNTVPHEIQKMQCHKIKTVDISLMLSEAIRRIYNRESMSYLFKDVVLDD